MSAPTYDDAKKAAAVLMQWLDSQSQQIDTGLLKMSCTCDSGEIRKGFVALTFNSDMAKRIEQTVEEVAGQPVKLEERFMNIG